MVRCTVTRDGNADMLCVRQRMGFTDAQRHPGRIKVLYEGIDEVFCCRF